MPESPVSLQSQDGVLLITLHRPKANAIDVPTSQALYEAFAKLDADPALRVGILTGVGRFFSAGWDLHAANAGEGIQANHGPGGFAGLTEFFTLRKPVIAAVNGLAIGGGFELALAADLIVASEAAEFALPEVKLGMMADSGGVLRLPQLIPQAIAREMLLTGRRMNAQEAARWGLVNQVVSAEQLLSAAHQLAQQLIQSAPLALAAVKEVLRETAHLSLQQGFARLRSGNQAAYQTMLQSQDAQEGPTAFAEKRPPVWTGK